MSEPSTPHGANDGHDEEPGPRDRAERTAEAEARESAEAEEDAEEVKGEWYVWIAGVLVVAGVALFFAPRLFLPELLGTLGLVLVLVGLTGLVVKWAIEWSA